MASQVSWGYTLPDFVTALSYSLVCVIALVLKALAIEASAGISVDLDAELKAAGIANIACGACGGALANHSASSVATLRRLGVTNRRVAIVALLMSLAALIWPQNLSNFVPTFVLGGLLLALGAGMVLDWAWLARRRMDASGFGALCAMMLTCALPAPRTPSASDCF